MSSSHCCFFWPRPPRIPTCLPEHLHRPEQSTPYRVVRQQAATFTEQAEAETGVHLPPFAKDELGAFLACGILARGYWRRRVGALARDGNAEPDAG